MNSLAVPAACFPANIPSNLLAPLREVLGTGWRSYSLEAELLSGGDWGASMVLDSIYFSECKWINSLFWSKKGPVQYPLNRSGNITLLRSA